MKNVMYFENGIEHEFTNDEMNLLKKAIHNLDEKEIENTKELENLKSLFLEHLD